MLSDSEAEVRSAAAEALGEIGDDCALEPLIALINDSEEEVRSAAARALGEIKNDRAVDTLIALLNDSETLVREAATYALGEISDDRAIEPLVNLLSDLDGDVRLVAIYALSISLDEIDRKLLSRHLDGVFPHLDPIMEISTEFVARAAVKLNIDVEDARARYEALEKRFQLHLAWRLRN